MAQDSDFIIFNCAKYFLSLKHLDYHKMITKKYDREKLASFLGIQTENLPLLATLLGNDIVSRNDLEVIIKGK